MSKVIKEASCMDCGRVPGGSFVSHDLGSGGGSFVLADTFG